MKNSNSFFSSHAKIYYVLYSEAKENRQKVSIYFVLCILPMIATIAQSKNVFAPCVYFSFLVKAKKDFSPQLTAHKAVFFSLLTEPFP